MKWQNMILGGLLAGFMGACSPAGEIEVAMTGAEETSLASDMLYVPLDADHDGVRDLFDNCRDLTNRSQSDLDHDGVGDACDMCGGPELGLVTYEFDFCCETTSWPDCRELSRWDGASQVYYWQDLYDSVSANGCGCLDTDGGENFQEAGQVYVETIVEGSCFRDPGGLPGDPMPEVCLRHSQCSLGQADECFRIGSDDYLREYYCDTAGLNYREVRCAGGCTDGRCACPDSDGGHRPFARGTLLGRTDFCQDATHVVEFFCSESSSLYTSVDHEVVSCNYGCVDGACVCADIDGGSNHDLEGRVGSRSERCINDRTLEELVPSVDIERGRCDLNIHNYRCPGLCFDGRCQPPSCFDGIENGDEETIDCGGSCLPCDLCALATADLPAHFDWRSWKGANWVTAVGDQESCGSCWAFAAVGAMEAMYNIEHFRTADSIERFGLDLAEQYLVSDCYDDGDCDGGYPEPVLRFLDSDGIVEEGCFPYEGRDTSCRSCGTSTGYEIGDWGEVDDRRSSIKRALTCHGPLMACGSGHCILIIGWNDPSDTWMIKNSWGTDWGDSGFGNLDNDHGWIEEIFWVSGARSW